MADITFAEMDREFNEKDNLQIQKPPTTHSTASYQTSAVILNITYFKLNVTGPSSKPDNGSSRIIHSVQFTVHSKPTL